MYLTIVLKNKIKKILNKYAPKVLSSYQRYKYERYIIPKVFISHINTLKPKDLTIDLGANRGMVTAAIARRGVEVIAFEPNSAAYKSLCQLAIIFPNIEVKYLAAGICNRKVKLYLHKDTKYSSEDLTQASSLMLEKSNVSNDCYETVDEIDFAEFLHTLDRHVEIIKMDIEGYEVALINHLLDTKMVEKVGMFYVETHEHRIHELAVPMQKLKSRIKREGYENKFFFEWP